LLVLAVTKNGQKVGSKTAIKWEYEGREEREGGEMQIIEVGARGSES